MRGMQPMLKCLTFHAAPLKQAPLHFFEPLNQCKIKEKGEMWLTQILSTAVSRICGDIVNKTLK
jgi:hypothetical protein